MRSGRVAPAFLVGISLAATACDGSINLRASLNGPSPIAGRQVTVEPAVLAPAFHTGTSCRVQPPFRLGFRLFVHADRDLVLRGLRFELIDRSGGRAHPLTRPDSLPVPIPRTLPFNGSPVRAHPIDVDLTFDCGVRPHGSLLIEIETAGHDGGSEISRLSVRVGE